MREEILVIGGAGYIGSHMVKLLAQRGFYPIVLDDLSTGHRAAVDSKTPFYQGSYGDSAILGEIFKTHQIKAIFHFGSKAIVSESVENPLYYYESNVSNTIHLLQFLQKTDCRYFIFSSTCATFGPPKTIPISESNPQNPINAYGMSKFFIEKILKDCFPAFQLNSVILRYFNAAGSDPELVLGEDHHPETHLIPNLVRTALGLQKSISIFGTDYETKDGTCVRDYVHVLDLCEAHIKAYEFLKKNPGVIDFNLGSEKGFSVLELISSFEKITQKPLNKSFEPRRAGDPPTLIANSKKAKDLLGWSPIFSLEEMLSSAYEWRKKNLNGYKK
jgi:UDP-glucose 4-epimerase